MSKTSNHVNSILKTNIGSIVIQHEKLVFVSSALLENFPELRDFRSSDELKSWLELNQESHSGPVAITRGKYLFHIESSPSDKITIVTVQHVVVKDNNNEEITTYLKDLATMISDVTTILSKGWYNDSNPVEHTLRLIREFTNVDSLYLFQPVDDTNLSVTFEWNQVTCNESKLNSVVHPLTKGSFLHDLNEFKTVIYNNVSRLSANKQAEINQLFDEVHSLILIPLNFEMTIPGFIALKKENDTIPSPPALTSILKITGELLANAIKRKYLFGQIEEMKNLNQMLIQNSPLGILIHQNKEVVFLNPKAMEMMGIENIPNHLDLIEFIPFDDQQRFGDFVERTYAGNYNLKWRNIPVRSRNKQLTHVSFVEVPFFYNSEPAALTFFRDYSKEHQLQVAVEQTNEQYRNLFETSLDAIYVSDTSGHMITWNRSFEDLFGYTGEELSEIDVKDLYHNVSDRVKFIKELEESKAVSNFEIELQHKNGEIRYCLISASKHPTRHDEIRGIIKNITEIKAATEAIIKSEKLNSISLLAGGVAHDINNILTVVSGYASLIDMATEDDEIKNMAQQLLKSSQHASNLTDQLLAYSGKKIKIAEPSRLTHEITSLQDLIQISTGARQTRFNYQLMDTGVVTIDPTQFSQVIINIIKNGIEAVNEDEAIIDIKTEIVELHSDNYRDFDIIEPERFAYGKYASVIIEDNGDGMNHQQLKSVFEPFFSTKFTGRGLGLSASLGIMKAHEGGIGIKSQKGKGSSFYLFFPMDQSPQVLRKRSNKDEEFHPKKALIIDDQSSVLTLTEQILKQLEIETDATTSLQDFFDLIKNNQYDLIIVDQSMPNLSGIELIAKLRRELHYKNKIILMSGYSKENFNGEYKKLKVDAFLKKPFDLNGMRKALRVLAKS